MNWVTAYLQSPQIRAAVNAAQPDRAPSAIFADLVQQHQAAVNKPDFVNTALSIAAPIALGVALGPAALAAYGAYRKFTAKQPTGPYMPQRQAAAAPRSRSQLMRLRALLQRRR